jgi:hypothetical protein
MYILNITGTKIPQNHRHLSPGGHCNAHKSLPTGYRDAAATFTQG